MLFRSLRASRPLLSNVFSRERGVLRQRALIGFADIFYAVFGVFLFGEVDEPAVAGVMALVCLLLLLTGLTLWLLAVLQLLGLLFRKEEKPAPEQPSGTRAPDL